MHYEISYNHLQKEEKRQQAVQDIENYVSAYIMEQLWHVGMNATKYQQFSFACSFAGVSGYPVVALWETIKQTLHEMIE